MHKERRDAPRKKCGKAPRRVRITARPDFMVVGTASLRVVKVCAIRAASARSLRDWTVLRRDNNLKKLPPVTSAEKMSRLSEHRGFIHSRNKRRGRPDGGGTHTIRGTGSR